MIRLIWAKVESVSGERAVCSAVSNADIKFDVYLNPLDREGQADTAQGTRIIALVDDVQGLGVCVYNENGFAFKFGRSVDISGDVSASGKATIGGNVTASGNVIAKDCQISITPSDIPGPAIVTSLANHTHAVTTAPGNTAPPTPTPIPSE